MRELEAAHRVGVASKDISHGFLVSIPYLSGSCILDQPLRKVRLTVMRQSSEPVARYFPSGLKDMARIHVPFVAERSNSVLHLNQSIHPN